MRKRETEKSRGLARGRRGEAGRQGPGPDASRFGRLFARSVHREDREKRFDGLEGTQSARDQIPGPAASKAKDGRGDGKNLPFDSLARLPALLGLPHISSSPTFSLRPRPGRRGTPGCGTGRGAARSQAGGSDVPPWDSRPGPRSWPRAPHVLAGKLKRDPQQHSARGAARLSPRFTHHEVCRRRLRLCPKPDR